MIVRMYRAACIASLLLVGANGAQPSAPPPREAPMRDLPWGQLNFLHTTDTHGWHGGHLLEPSYSADWGDYISFAKHMRDRADDDGVDLLLVDTGDRIEGNGLYDASDPKGQYTFDIFKHQDIDVICSGNHELYKANSSNNEYFQTVPNFKGNYLASNLDIHDNKTGELVPLAPRYKKFTTRNQGITIAAFGFIFNFQDSSNNTVITLVEDAIKQDWFQDMIRDKSIDLFLVAGHVGLRSEEFKMIFEAIRAQQWDVPIQFLGGHTHIRDYAKYDNKAYALESGRYMETVGFASVSGIKTKSRKHKDEVNVTRNSPTFERRYIDNNLFSYHYHTALNSTTFPTNLGKNVTKQIAEARNALDLDSVHGCAPKDLWLNRAALKDENSIFRWLGEEVVPDTFSGVDTANTSTGSKPNPKLILTNTGAIRFDIFAGPFTRDTTYQVTPFTSGFRALRDVNYAVASKVLSVINREGPVLASLAQKELGVTLDARALMPPGLGHSQHAEEASSFVPAGDNVQLVSEEKASKKHKQKLTPGYTTTDDLGTDGDDTVHSEIKYYKVPNCIQSQVDFGTADTRIDDAENTFLAFSSTRFRITSITKAPEKVDLVYNAFIEPWIILALRFLGQSYGVGDTVEVLGGKSMTSMMAGWVEEHWRCDQKGLMDEL